MFSDIGSTSYLYDEAKELSRDLAEAAGARTATRALWQHEGRKGAGVSDAPYDQMLGIPQLQDLQSEQHPSLSLIVNPRCCFCFSSVSNTLDDQMLGVPQFQELQSEQHPSFDLIVKVLF